jgi:hypothetical protein
MGSLAQRSIKPTTNNQREEDGGDDYIIIIKNYQQ